MTLAYRRVQDETSTRAVALIVICDACGDREIGWAWHDKGRVMWWRGADGAFIPPARDSARAELFRKAHNRILQATPKDDQRRLRRQYPASMLIGRARLKVRCPHHGNLVTPEINPVELEPAMTRRIRAIRSTA